MSKMTIFLLISLYVSFAYSQSSSSSPSSTSDYAKLVLESPDLSIRCRFLLTNRETYRDKKQRMLYLTNKNDQLLKRAPLSKEVVRKKLKIVRQKLIQELSLIRRKITNLEEKIIRQGCPGLVQ